MKASFLDGWLLGTVQDRGYVVKHARFNVPHVFVIIDAAPFRSESIIFSRAPPKSRTNARKHGLLRTQGVIQTNSPCLDLENVAHVEKSREGHHPDHQEQAAKRQLEPSNS